MIALVGFDEEPSPLPEELGGAEAELAVDAEPSFPEEEVENGLEVVDSLFGIFSTAGFDDESLSSATPFSSGTTCGKGFSVGLSLLLTFAFSAAEVGAAISSPVFDLSLPLSLSATVLTFSFPF